MKIFILGANGFIGSHLSEAILHQTAWQVTAMDLANDNLEHCIGHEKFIFFKKNMLLDSDWVTEQIQEADVILPLVAIATPALYVQDPLRVFELDFEANLHIIKQCVHYKKRVIFPSTSEVYGMCTDAAFNEETSHLVTGPIHKERWIYSTSKQLLDRVIFAYGKHQGLAYTLFRPFNWFGPRLDNVFNPKPGGSRVLTQFIGNIFRGENIMLVGGGAQQRCFAYIEDGIEALIKIIANENECAHQQIFNLGSPTDNISIRQLAERLIELIGEYPLFSQKAKHTRLMDISADDYYGSGYQDVVLRVPSIQRAEQQLKWSPKTRLIEGLKKTIQTYCNDPSVQNLIR